MTETQPSKEGLDLVLQLIEGSMKSTHDTTNRLIDNLAAERDRLQAEIMLIRDTIQELLGSDYMPTTRAIMNALYPHEMSVRNAVHYYIERGDIQPLPKMYEVDGPAN